MHDTENHSAPRVGWDVSLWHFYNRKNLGHELAVLEEKYMIHSAAIADYGQVKLAFISINTVSNVVLNKVMLAWILLFFSGGCCQRCCLVQWRMPTHSWCWSTRCAKHAVFPGCDDLNCAWAEPAALTGRVTSCWEPLPWSLGDKCR